jgi:neutral ceramidase
MTALLAGSAVVDISPNKSLHLCGYPIVERNSTGIHDPLLSSALYLDDGATRVLFIANDIIFVPKGMVQRARRRLAEQTGLSPAHILIAATHTHSGPLTVDRPYRGPSSPPPDAAYVAQLEEGIVQAGLAACRSARPAEAGLAVADGSAVGTNRRDPRGASNPRVPVLSVREAATRAPLALLAVCSMHPTVLHEDSTLVSADFPGMARRHLQQQAVGPACPILYFTGPAGNQSPRHVTRANTFEEAERLGGLLGQSIEKAIGEIRYRCDWKLDVRGAGVELPRRSFMPAPEAEALERAALDRLETMRRDGSPRGAVRTAECDWFGATRRANLARFAAAGRLEEAAAQLMPAEIQVIRLGPWAFVAWPGELFVEFALAVIRAHSQAFPIAYANGETDGYLVTAEAAAEGGYEAAGGIFSSPESGERLVSRTLDLLASMKSATPTETE